MLTSSTIRFTTDTFGEAVPFVDEPIEPQPVDPDAPDTPDDQPTFKKQALLTSKTPLDCTKKSAVDSFLITGAEPEGSRRRLVFIIDDLVYKFRDGQLSLWNYDLTYENVISYGNKVSVLNALSDITGFVGKKIYPVIALKAPYDADEYPTCKVALATRTFNDQLVETFDSPIYELAAEAETIINIEAQTTIVGSAELELTVRLHKGDTWTSYMNFTDAVDESADAVQFKCKATVADASGSNSAKVDSITVTHTSGQAVVTATNKANIYSKVQSYGVDLQTAYVVVRHAPLIDSTIEAYVNFMAEPKHRDLVQFGTGTGSRQELHLEDSGIVPTSLVIYQDDEQVTDFDFSTELSTIIITAKKNSVLYASYDYDYGTENWRKMTADEAQPYNDIDNTYSTRYTYTLSDEASVDKKIANVRIRLIRNSGSASETLGKATGKTQLFTLNHNPKLTTIRFTEDVTWSYDETSGILSCVAIKGKTIKVNYDYLGVAPQVYSFAAGFSVD